MLQRAAEMGWSESRFWSALFIEFMWCWNGYLRKTERAMQMEREIAAMIHNTNVKKGKQKKAKKLYPLRIDYIPPQRTPQEIADMFKSIPEDWKK